MATRYNYTGGIVTDGLVLHLDAAKRDSYPGSGTTWTDLANGATGALTNGPTYTGVAKDAAFEFDGVNDYVAYGDIVDVSTGNYTVSLWTYINSSPTHFQTIFAKKGIAAANAGYAIYYNGSTKKLLWSNGNASVAQEYYTTSAVPLDTWINVVKIRDVNAATKGTFYINGQLYPITQNPTGLDVSNTYNLTFHRAANANTYFFSGKTASTGFYNRALTASEITQNYNALKGRYGL